MSFIDIIILTSCSILIASVVLRKFIFKTNKDSSCKGQCSDCKSNCPSNQEGKNKL